MTNVGVLAGSLLIGTIAGVMSDEQAALQAALLAACVANGGILHDARAGESTRGAGAGG